eukprot:1878801-Pleurochrysis_carterae.AAC.1
MEGRSIALCGAQSTALLAASSDSSVCVEVGPRAWGGSELAPISLSTRAGRVRDTFSLKSVGVPGPGRSGEELRSVEGKSAHASASRVASRTRTARRFGSGDESQEIDGAC